jgi:hypothetical protein
MSTKSVELAIFWLPLVAGVLLGGIAASAWYGGDRIAAIWISFVGLVCLLLTGAFQAQQYVSAHLLQPEIEVTAPALRSVLRWDDPKKQPGFTVLPENKTDAQIGLSISPKLGLKSRNGIFAQDATVEIEIPYFDLAALASTSNRLGGQYLQRNGDHVILGTQPTGPFVTFPVSTRRVVRLPFIARDAEVEIPYDLLYYVALYFITTLPDQPGKQAPPVTADIVVKWAIPAGDKISRHRLMFNAVTAQSSETTGPFLLATIALSSEPLP